MRDDSAEILFQSFLKEALVSSSGMGSLDLSSVDRSKLSNVDSLDLSTLDRSKCRWLQESKGLVRVRVRSGWG